MNDFISWLDGFLTNKTTLTEEEISIIRNKMAEHRMCSFNTGANGTGFKMCQFPNDCGMPTAWWGTVPPICTKCGKQGEIYPVIYCDGK